MAGIDLAKVVLSEHPIMSSSTEKNIYFQLQRGPLSGMHGRFGGIIAILLIFLNGVIINKG